MASDILRRVGWALILVGLLDIGFMVYCIMNDINYSSSLNIFAVVAGVFLRRQSLQTARIVTFFAAFMFAGIGLTAIIFSLLVPFGLLAAQVRLHPLSSIGAFLFAAAFLVFAFWVYRSLTSPAVMEARRIAGLSAKKPRAGFVAGVALAVGLSIVLALVNNGPAAEKAIAKAREQAGPDYNYYVTSMQWSGDSGRAIVTAYNAREIKEIGVEW